MKVLLIRPGPGFSVQDVCFGWRDGLRELGATVGDLRYDDRLDAFGSAELAVDGEYRRMYSLDAAYRLAAKTILSDCYEFWPDVVLIVCGFFIPPDIVACMKSRGHKIVYLFTESPYEDDSQLAKAHLADLVIVNDPTNLEKFRQICPASYYVPHAYRPDTHYPGPVNMNMVCDFGFVGTGFPSRVEFFEQVDFGGLDVIFGGSWVALPDESPLAPLVGHERDQCIDNADTADLYRSAKTSLNLYRREVGHNGITTSAQDTADGWAMGPREVELAACGTFFLRDPRPEGDEVFPMLPTFSEPGEVRPLLDWWLTHPKQRHQVAGQARAAIADRTFTNNAAWLLRQLSEGE